MKCLAPPGFRTPSPKLLRKLERHRPSLKGKFAAIELESGRYFIADRGIEAALAAHEAIPGGKFFLVRIGYATARKIAGPGRRL